MGKYIAKNVKNSKKRKRGKKTRMVVLSDFHCGHRAGMTPKQFQQHNTPFYNQQYRMWNWYCGVLKSLKPIDIVVVVGDAIDGKASKSGGTEQLTVDRREQVIMAEKVVREVAAKKHYFVHGTRYHVSQEGGEDWENVLANMFKAPIRGHLQMEVEKTGIIFDFKHKIAGSSTPYGQHTPLMKEKIWNMVWAYYDGQRDANIIIRSHVHDFKYNGDEKYLNIVTPGLQGFGSKYGVRECSRIIKVGFIYFDIYENGEVEWEPKIMKYEVIKEVDGILTARIV